MSQKDTLTLYEDLINTGVPEEQAKIQAHQLGSLGDEVNNTCKEIKVHLIKIEKDMYWMRVIGASLVLCFMSNIFWLSR